jgi:membrane-associated phospholipid phosphatase
MVAFQTYKMVRRTFVQRAQEVAYDNALQILRWEAWLGIDVELDLQRRIIEHDWLFWFFNRYYMYFMWMFYACAAAAMLLAPVRYRHLRRVFLLSMLLALPWFALYPLAPPRFMGEYGYPFIDSQAVYGPRYFSGKGLVAANQFAAMPSMHCGWTFIGAVMLAYALPRWRIGLILGATYLAVMFLTVVVTGHHYILDIVGGLLTAGAAFLVARLLPEEIPWPWRRWQARRAGAPAEAGAPTPAEPGLAGVGRRLEPAASAGRGRA